MDIVDPTQNYDPTSVSIAELMEDWKIVMAWWELRASGEFTYSKEQLVNIAAILFREMLRRGLEPPDPVSPAEEELTDIVLHGQFDETDMAYKEEFSVTVNRIGTIDCDAVKGCWGSCYGGACYALQTAGRFGWDFHDPKIRYFEEGEREKFIRQIQKAAKDEKKKWARIGVMGDPSISWSNTVRVAGLIRDAGIVPVIITKHRKLATDAQLKQLEEIGAILHTSVCLLDGAVWKKRYNQALRFGRMGGKSLVRLVTYEGKDAENEEMQKIIKTCPLTILETPLRIPKTNPLVVAGRVLNPNEPVKLTDIVCAAEPPFDCRKCKQQCCVDFKFKKIDEDLAPVLPSEKEPRERIFLQDVLQKFKSFYTSKPNIYLVGGICNHPTDGTEGDIDILIRGTPPEGNGKLPLLFRLYRMFPPELRSRLHVSWGQEEFGPFTNHIPLYDVLYERRQDKEVILMSADATGDYPEFQNTFANPSEEPGPIVYHKPDKKDAVEESKARGIKPFRFFEMLKGQAGYRKNETYSLEGLQEQLLDKDYPYEVDEKFDGMRIQIHKKGNDVKIYSINGENLTAKLDSLVKELITIPIDFVMDAELTGLVKGKTIGRSTVAGFMHSREPVPSDVTLIANVFDILYFKDQDIHKLSLEARRKMLETLPRKLSYINIIPTRVAKDWNELKAAIKWASAFEGSEGAMIKSLASAYPLTGFSSKWIKYKVTADLDAEVVAVHSVEGSTTKNYLCIIRSARGDPVPVGRTYNTPIQAKVGDIIRVSFGNLNEYTDPKTEKIWYNWVFPRVIEAREDKDKPDTDLTAHEIFLATKGESGNKVTPKAYAEILKDIETDVWLENFPSLDLDQATHTFNLTEDELTDLFLAAPIGVNHHRAFAQRNPVFDADPFNTPADEEKKWKFVLQNHFRGKSVHGDLRMERPSFLIGWTLNYQEEGKPSQPISSLEEAATFAKSQDNIKNLRKTTGSEGFQIVVEKKELQPLEWLNVKEKFEKGEVGATKEFPAVYDIVANGEVEFGTQKPYFHEYFIRAETGAYKDFFDGRLVVRLLKNTWGGRAGKGKFVWMAWFADDVTPYIITPRAVSINEMPPPGLSWLPREVRKRIPKLYRYWTMTDQKKAKEARDMLVDAITKKVVKIDSIEDLPKEGYFILTEICWRGPIVVRGGCSRKENILFLQQGQKKLAVYLDGNPILTPKVSAAIGEAMDKKWSHMSGSLPNESPLNPDKETPAKQERLAQGKFKILEREPNSITFSFESDGLKGKYILHRTRPMTSLWIFKKSE